MNVHPRPHCTCTEVQNFSVEAAAERLACRVRRLLEELRADRIPHQKIGDQRVLCPCELLIAMRVFTVAAPTLAPQTDAVSDISTRLRSISPARGRRSSTA